VSGIFPIFFVFLIWKNALMHVLVQIYMTCQSYLEVVDPDCGSVMEQNIENQVMQKYLLDKGDRVNR
jgi:hypothetical protein